MSEMSYLSITRRIKRLQYFITALLLIVTMFPALMFVTRQSAELGAILEDEVQFSPLVQRSDGGSLSDGSELRQVLSGSLAERLPLIFVVLGAFSVFVSS